MIYLKKIKQNEYNLNSDTIPIKLNNLLGHFLHGLKLKSYIFEKYKTKKSKKKISIIVTGKNKPSFKDQVKFKAIEEGTFYTRDLVSEPGNILHPDEYAKRLNSLKKYGLKINIYDEKKLKKLGMNTLLGVGQGSIRGSYLVTMEWNGAKDKSKPLAFVGKGVCFDTGGISLKPAKFMEDMTYDMAGSAVVVGLMKSLALRKAKINAVGVVGLVENMPGGNAQRPGDIVKSYSGKTVEILNTDAEGRLVLADALTYTEEKFKPKFIVDLATLTGAIIVSLGSEYAGLFSNDDKLSNQLIKAGENVEEKVWRMPLNKNFDKLIDSKNADMQNIKKMRLQNFIKFINLNLLQCFVFLYLSSGPIIVMILEGKNAVLLNRQIMGSTDPKLAEENTIRKKFGISIDKNSVHGSDSLENAQAEIKFFFKN